MMLLTEVAVLLISLLAGVDGHGRLVDPPGRSTMWRLGYHTPVNTNDHQLSCGGFGVQFYRNGGKCGVCGDPFQGPRDNEAGGKYATGTIGASYSQGQVITVTTEITVNHGGWFEFKLCPVNDRKVRATPACLDKHLLRVVGGGTRYTMVTGLGQQSVRLQLPKELTCSQCVLQWKWNTASNVACNGSRCCHGCGPQEQFYGCADVSILPGAVPPQTHVTMPHQIWQPHPAATRPPHNQGAPISFIPLIPGGVLPVATRPPTNPGASGSFIPIAPDGLLPAGLVGIDTVRKCAAREEFRLEMPNADVWCITNCKLFNNCRKDLCTEECRTTVQQPDNKLSDCKAQSFWRLELGGQAADEWCRQRCAAGPCPLDFCEKDCLM